MYPKDEKLEWWEIAAVAFVLIASLLACILVSGCAHTYTPSESQARIEKLESDLKATKADLKEAEDDLTQCLDLQKKGVELSQ